MTTNGVWVVIDGSRIGAALQEALEKLDGAEGEMTLDFSSVRRIDSAALRAMEKLAENAGAKAIKVVVRGVNVGTYKALKLGKLTQRFTFEN